MKSFLFLMLFSLPLFAQEIKVLTWNTFLIPPPWNTTRQAERVRQMIEKLPTFHHDLMLFQETFFDKKRKLMMKALEKTHPHFAVPIKGRKLKQIQDSGLFIASRYPLEILDQVIFSDCIHSDCLSSKSAILVEISLGQDKKIQVMNTHLQAWNDEKAVAVRKKQLEQIRTMMARHERPGIAQILIGDLNIDGKLKTEYGDALTFMNMHSTPLEGPLLATNGFSTEGCFKNPGGDSQGEWLDHMWVKPNGSAVQILTKQVLPIHGLIRSKECPLSDHYAVEAIIKL